MTSLSAEAGTSTSAILPTFPPEVLEEVFHYLSPIELSRLAQTSRLLHQVSTSSTLWERAYLAFWREADNGKDEARGTRRWRDTRRQAEMKDAAKRAWLQDGVMAEGSMQFAKRRKREAAVTSQKSFPFPIALSCRRPDDSSSSFQTRAEVNFYKLFQERIRIDGEVLEVVYRQCQSPNKWMRRVRNLVDEHGNDAKDILHALLTCQLRQDSNQTTLFTKEECSDHFDFSTALQLRLPNTKASRSHRLSLIHYGRELLEHLRRREALQGLLSLRPDAGLISRGAPWEEIHIQDGDDESEQQIEHARKAKGFENAIAWLSMFRGGEGQENAEELDTLAISCSLYLASHDITLEDDARQFASGIYQFINNRGFKGAIPAEYKNLDNNFLHFCLDESGRNTLPMSLVVIFCAIATRLGLAALPTNTPARILAVISSTQVSSSQGLIEDRFWVDVYEDGLIMEINDVAAFLSRMRCPLTELFIAPSKPADACTRAARNIVMSVQGAQGVPHIRAASMLSFEAPEDQDAFQSVTEDGIQQADRIFDKLVKTSSFLFTPRRTHMTDSGPYLNSPFWSIEKKVKVNRYERVNTWSDFDQQASMHAASNALTRIGDEFGSRGNDWCASLIQSYFPLDTLIMRDEYVDERRSSPLLIRDAESRQAMTSLFDTLISDDEKGPLPTSRTLPEHKNIYPVGILFTHRVQKYKAAIIGWTDTCSAPEEWIISMRVDSLPNRGRHQPFYHSVVEDGSTRYVAHCNIIPATSSTNGLAYLSSPRISSPGLLKPSSVMSASDVESVVQQRGIGKLFRCVVEDNGHLRLLKNQQGEQAFPDD